MFIFYCLEHLNIGIIIVYILLVCIFKGSFHIWMHFMTRLSTWDLFERGDFDVNRTKFGHNLCIDQIYLNRPCLMEFINNDLYFAESIRFYVGWIHPWEKEATRTINYNEIGMLFIYPLVWSNTISANDLSSEETLQKYVNHKSGCLIPYFLLTTEVVLAEKCSLSQPQGPIQGTSKVLWSFVSSKNCGKY